MLYRFTIKSKEIITGLFIFLLSFQNVNAINIKSNEINEEVKDIISDTIFYNDIMYIKSQEQHCQTDKHLSRHDKIATKYVSTWNKLIPSYQKIQMYGSIGLVSVGTGWHYCNKKLESEVLLCFIPKYDDTKCKFTLTLRENYIPFNITIKENVLNFDPLIASFYVNSLLDNRFWKREPDKYPDNYYKFSTRIRTQISLGQRFNFDLDGERTIHKSLSVFYEIGTCDLYFISAATNKYLRPKDYLGLSFGLKLQMF